MIRNILIIEDEKPNASRLKRILGNVAPDITILDVLENVVDSIAWFKKNEMPDLVLMDVRLADGLSFELFEQVKISSSVIFTTAFDEYAVQAFKFNSVDYLLKPICNEDLESALKKAEARNSALSQRSIEGLVSQFLKKEYRSRFLLPYRDGFKTLLVSEIDFFFSESRITRAKIINGGDEIVNNTLEQLEQQLDPRVFFRVNRQYILSIDAIKRIHNHFNGKLKIELKKYPELDIFVSRDRSHALKIWLDF